MAAKIIASKFLSESLLNGDINRENEPTDSSDSEDEGERNAFEEVRREIQQYVDNGSSTTLTELDLSDMGIEILPSLKALVSLSGLYLYDNNIRELTDCFPPSLTVLILSYNKIERVSSLKALVSLSVLHLDYNNIRELTDCFPPSLTELILSDNKIERVSSLKALVSLSVLDLSGNNIRELTDCFPPSLTELWLRNNKIERVSRLKALVSLSKLYLRNNNIRELTDCFPPSLTKLLLWDNKIERISSSLIDALDEQTFEVLKKALSQCNPTENLKEPPWDAFKHDLQYLLSYVRQTFANKSVTDTSNGEAPGLYDIRSLPNANPTPYLALATLNQGQAAGSFPNDKAMVSADSSTSNSYIGPNLPPYRNEADLVISGYNAVGNVIHTATPDSTVLEVVNNDLKKSLEEREGQIRTLEVKYQDMVAENHELKSKLGQYETANENIPVIQVSDVQSVLGMDDAQKPGTSGDCNMNETQGVTGQDSLDTETFDGENAASPSHHQELEIVTKNDNPGLSVYISAVDIQSAERNSHSPLELASELMSLLFTDDELMNGSASARSKKPLLDPEKLMALRGHINLHFQVSEKDLSKHIYKVLRKYRARNRRGNHHNTSNMPNNGSLGDPTPKSSSVPEMSGRSKRKLNEEDNSTLANTNENRIAEEEPAMKRKYEGGELMAALGNSSRSDRNAAEVTTIEQNAGPAEADQGKVAFEVTSNKSDDIVHPVPQQATENRTNTTNDKKVPSESITIEEISDQGPAAGESVASASPKTTVVQPAATRDESSQNVLLNQPNVQSLGQTQMLQQTPFGNIILQPPNYFPINQGHVGQMPQYLSVPGFGLLGTNTFAPIPVPNNMLQLPANNLFQHGQTTPQMQVAIPGASQINSIQNLCQIAHQAVGLLGQLLIQQTVQNTSQNNTRLPLQAPNQGPVIQLVAPTPNNPSTVLQTPRVNLVQNTATVANNIPTVQLQVLDHQSGQELYNSSCNKREK